MLYLEHVMEFVDHIAPSCSTHEYFRSSEYEALTPSRHGDTEIQYFHLIVQLKTQRKTLDSVVKHCWMCVQNTEFLYLHDEKELEIHIWGI